MPKLSAFLITKNESHDIDLCLQSLKGVADEIVVVDDFSGDDTVKKCEAFGAKVYSRKLDGFGPQKQFALEKTTGDWVFSIDADERITPALAHEIKHVMSSPDNAYGFSVRRNFYFLGNHLRYGGLGGDWVIRLFRRNQGRFRNVKVHEAIDVAGPIGVLNEPLDHYSYANLREYLDKCSHYTALAAQEQYAKGKRFFWADHLRPGWELFVRVFLRSAWRDGTPGLIYAALSSHAAWLRAVHLWEIEKHTNQKAKRKEQKEGLSA